MVLEDDKIMQVRVVGSVSNYHENTLVYRIVKFLLENNGYLEVYARIVIEAKRKDRRDKVINDIIKGCIEEKIIDSNKLQEFLSLIDECFNSHDPSDTQGKVVEYLISSIGPLILENNNLEIKNNAKIEVDGVLLGEKNLDVVYTNNSETAVDFIGEFVECKVDLDSYLFKKPSRKKVDDLKDEAQKKLRFLNYVNDYLKHTNSKIIFVSLRKSKRKALEVMSSLNYDTWANVMTYEDIIDVVETK
ncbi:MAG: hypothetical protein K9L17_08195 [Clostridiales bacterium]|nr:hypothetical protein [Clostridiales bacterium]